MDQAASDKKAHIPALDGVRGVAVTMVVLVHFFNGFEPVNEFERLVSQVAGHGALGVDLFFVLSGFLITGILIGSKQRPHYFKNFYMRRLLRIFPLYYGVLVVIFLGLRWLPFAAGPSMDKMVENQWWAWGYGINLLVAKAGVWTPPYISHFWSLAVEEHFYLVWPLLVFYLSDRGLRLTCWGLIVASTALSVFLEIQHVNELAIYTLTPCRLNGLCSGGLLAVYVRQRPLTGRHAWILLGITVMVKALIILVNHFDPDMHAVLDPFRSLTWTTGFLALVLGAVTAPADSWLGRFLTWRAMVSLGKYSYGMYVFHHFLSTWGRDHGWLDLIAEALSNHTVGLFAYGGGGFVLSVLIAMISYHAFEKHFLKLKVRFE